MTELEQNHVSTVLFQGKASDFGAFSIETLNHRHYNQHQIVIVSSGTLAAGVYNVRILPDADEILEASVDTGAVLTLAGGDSAFVKFTGILRGIHLEVSAGLTAGETISAVLSSTVGQLVNA